MMTSRTPSPGPPYWWVRPRPGQGSACGDAMKWLRALLNTVVPTPATPPPAPRTIPPGWYGDQLLSDAERTARWARTLERQRREAADEAEARAWAAEQLRQAIEQSPHRAYFPPADPSQYRGLFAFIDEMTRRRD